MAVVNVLFNGPETFRGYGYTEMVPDEVYIMTEHNAAEATQGFPAMFEETEDPPTEAQHDELINAAPEAIE
jgi:hypothetical protein